MNFTGLLAPAFFLAAALPAVAAPAAATGHFNVLFILADDLRGDTVHVLGNPDVQTPELDRLAARGAIFPRATCGYPICWVARSEMIAGRSFLGVNMTKADMGTPKLSPDWPLWPQVMKSYGWHTIESGKWNVSGTPWKDGFDETAGLFSAGGGLGNGRATLMVTPTGRIVTGYTGWTFKDPRNEPQPQFGTGLTPDTDIHMIDLAIDAIRRTNGRPFFLQINLTETHDPLHWPRGMDNHIDYHTLPLPRNFRPDVGFETGNRYGRDEMIVPAPRSGEDVKKERAIYFTQVENVDRLIGRILRALKEMGQFDNTLVIFTSDQGLALGSHGLMGKQNEFEHTINVPLILAGPGIPAGKIFNAQCYDRDLYPTVCEMAGIPIPASVQGRSLLPILQGKKRDIYDRIFGYFTGTQRMVRENDGWKLIWYPAIGKYQLFHLPSDPLELQDLSAGSAQAGRMAAMKAELTDWQLSAHDPLLNPTAALFDDPSAHDDL